MPVAEERLAVAAMSGLSGLLDPRTEVAESITVAFEPARVDGAGHMSNRPYRAAWPHDQVLEHVRRGAGSHFDPSVVEAFLGMSSDQAVTASNVT